ncbi:hypothetical protein RN001_015657 [Aquatica leii]|uniref:Uncharacterized protein n=1 Tax=Aquatica leii TaxID=1421715 RepID=A0AAN7QAQ9_9COLE|nr:hypothetical protein RN001_015657 [Aquatica leii]
MSSTVAKFKGGNKLESHITPSLQTHTIDSAADLEAMQYNVRQYSDFFHYLSSVSVVHDRPYEVRRRRSKFMQLWIWFKKTFCRCCYMNNTEERCRTFF